MRHLVDRLVGYVLLLSALISTAVVFLIGVFILQAAMPAIREIGLKHLLTSPVWRPQRNEFGLGAMILSSILVTVGAMSIGVPLSLGCAIFLAEVAPAKVRAIVRPAVELLAGIPSVVYGKIWIVNGRVTTGLRTSPTTITRRKTHDAQAHT